MASNESSVPVEKAKVADSEKKPTHTTEDSKDETNEMAETLDQKRPIPSTEDSIQFVEKTSDDKLTEILNETECMKFADKLYKIVEELKMNRVGKKDNEHRIQKLMSENSDLERLKDDEIMKNNELVQKYNFKEQDIKKQCEEKLHSFQEDKAKHVLEKQCGEKEIKALKDEIRTLHITKYTMEKLIKDQERQIQSHGATTTNYLTQLAKLEKQCKDLFQQCSQIITAVDKVEVNVNTSSKLHKKLTYINCHQNCLLKSYKEQLEQTKQDLITTEARCASLTNAENNIRDSSSSVHLENELRMQKQLCQQVQVQLNDTRKENQELLKSLNNAHELLGKHIETNNKFVETEAALQLEMDELRTERDQLKTQTSNTEEKNVQLNEAMKTLEERGKEFCEKLEKLANENSSLSKEKEELNSTWLEKKVEHDEEQKKLKEKIKELEELVEGAKQEKAKREDEMRVLEDNLNKKVTCNEDLLQKSHQDNSMKSTEIAKLLRRTEELVENEEKLKRQLDKMGKKEQSHQTTQTEKSETQEKGTSTNINEVMAETIVLSTDKGQATNAQLTVTVDRSQPQLPSVTSPQSGNPEQDNNKTEQKCTKNNLSKHVKHRQLAKDGGAKPNDQNVDMTDKKDHSKTDATELPIGIDIERTGLKGGWSGNHSRKYKGTQHPVEETSPAKKPCLERTVVTSTPVTSSRNDICIESKEDGVTYSQDSEKEPILPKPITKKQTALLAVVKPAVSTQRVRNTGHPSPNSHKTPKSNMATKSPSPKPSFTPPHRAVPTPSIVSSQASANKSDQGISMETNITSSQIPGAEVKSQQLQQGVSAKDTKAKSNPIANTSREAPSQHVQPQIPNNQFSRKSRSGDNPVTHSIQTTPSQLSHNVVQAQSIQPETPSKPFSGNRLPHKPNVSTTNTLSQATRNMVQPQTAKQASCGSNTSHQRNLIIHSDPTANAPSVQPQGRTPVQPQLMQSVTLLSSSDTTFTSFERKPTQDTSRKANQNIVQPGKPYQSLRSTSLEGNTITHLYPTDNASSALPQGAVQALRIRQQTSSHTSTGNTTTPPEPRPTTRSISIASTASDATQNIVQPRKSNQSSTTTSPQGNPITHFNQTINTSSVLPQGIVQPGLVQQQGSSQPSNGNTDTPPGPSTSSQLTQNIAQPRKRKKSSTTTFREGNSITQSNTNNNTPSALQPGLAQQQPSSSKLPEQNPTSHSISGGNTSSQQLHLQRKVVQTPPVQPDLTKSTHGQKTPKTTSIEITSQNPPEIPKAMVRTV